MDAERRYTVADIRHAEELRAAGYTWVHIAKVLGRPSGAAVRYRCHRYADDQEALSNRARAKDRPCMGCRQMFPSEHAGHRHCDPCRSVLNGASPFETERGDRVRPAGLPTSDSDLSGR